MEMKLRKHQSTLVVAGTGVILFGLWSIVKSILFIVSIREDLVTYSIELGLTSKVVIGILLAIVAVILGTDLIMRLYIGLCAISEGKGKKKRNLFLLFAGFLFCSSVTSLPASLQSAYTLTDFSMDTFIAMVLELTSLYAMGDLIFSGVRAKQLQKQLET